MVRTLAASALLVGLWCGWAQIQPGDGATLVVDVCQGALSDFQAEHPKLVSESLANAKCVAENPGWDPTTRTLRFQIDPTSGMWWGSTFARGYVRAWGDQIGHLHGEEAVWAAGRGIPVEKAWDDWMELALSAVRVPRSGAVLPPGIDQRFIRDGRAGDWFPPAR